ncbi:MAG: DUF6781 family protein [Caldimonas sp.]
MMKAGIDQDALITLFSDASAKQGEALRKAVSAATLKALQGRELTLGNIGKVVQSVAGAATLGAGRNAGNPVDVEAMLGNALAGIDGALLQAVEANRRALEQFVSSGMTLGEKPLKQALANIEKMEDTFFAAVSKAGQASGPMQTPWDQALAAMKMKGSETGMQANQTVESLVAQAQTMLRDGRASGMRAAQAMLDSYAAMVSGVLIGMSEGMQVGAPAKAEPPSSGGGATAPAASPAPTKKTVRRAAARRKSA